MENSKKTDFRECLSLYWIFFKIGAVLFGGGYAILPFLQREFVEKREWVTNDQITDYFAIGQCTPGIIAVNVATFIGHKRQRFWGALFGTLGVVTPSIVIITLIAALLTNFMDIGWVQHAFAGIRIVVAAMIVNAVLKLIRSGVKNWLGIVIFAAALILGIAFSVSPIFIVVGAALAGLLLGGKGAER